MVQRKLLFACTLGNALEFFDFTLYGVFASLIARIYFPDVDPTASLLKSLGAFAVGFLARPFGGLFFGYIGDKFGRKRALSLSILLMGVPTFTIAFLPGYETLGVTASIIVVLCRICQGLCTGGEYNGAAIFALEHFGKKPGYIGGYITASCVIGALLATSLASFVQRPDMPEWAWRMPFFLGGFISILGYYVRRNLSETPEFLKFVSSRKTQKVPILESLRLHKKECFMTFAIGSLNGTLSYTLFGFLNIYLSKYFGIPLEQALQLNILGLLTFMVGCPILGAAYDRFGGRIFLRLAAFGITLGIVPVFMCLSESAYSLIICGQIGLGLFTASIAGTSHAAMQSLFPINERYSAISFFFSIGMGIFGGLAPMLYVKGIDDYHFSMMFPAYFLMGLSVVFLLVTRSFFHHR